MEYCSCCMSPLVGGRCPRGCAPSAEEAPHILPPGTLLNGRYLIAMLAGDIWRIHGSPAPDLTGIAFQNISATDWHYAAFAWVANMGLISKDPDVDPTQRATGEDLAALLYALSQ